MNSLHSRKIRMTVKVLKIELKSEEKNLSSSEHWGALKFQNTLIPFSAICKKINCTVIISFNVNSTKKKKKPKPFFDSNI